MENTKRILNLVLIAIAVAMTVAVIVLGSVLNSIDTATQVSLLAIGLFTLSLATLQREV